MRTETEPEETSLFLRKQGEEDDDNFDDTSLVKAYDKAIYKAKQQILNKIQGEMSLTDSDVQDMLGDVPISEKGKKNVSAVKISIWKVGSACRAIYSEDGDEYEAEIIKIIDENLCTVRFVGYNNEEDVPLKELTRSLGKSAIQQQIITSRFDETSLEEEGTDLGEQDSEEEVSEAGPAEIKPKEIGEAGPAKVKLPYRPRRVPMMHPNYTFPPPPPRLPGTFCGPAGGMASPSVPLPTTNDEALNAMLNAWYLCGYYTGYYQRDLKDRLK